MYSSGASCSSPSGDSLSDYCDCDSDGESYYYVSAARRSRRISDDAESSIAGPPDSSSSSWAADRRHQSCYCPFNTELGESATQFFQAVDMFLEDVKIENNIIVNASHSDDNTSSSSSNSLRPRSSSKCHHQSAMTMPPIFGGTDDIVAWTSKNLQQSQGPRGHLSVPQLILDEASKQSSRLPSSTTRPTLIQCTRLRS